MQIAALNRWGGDATSSYNWKIDVSNAGADWNCANYTGRFTSPSPDPSLKSSSDQFVRYNIGKSADTLMTIPITGWVASMASPNPGNPDCAGASAIASCCTTLGTTEEELIDKGSGTLDTSFMGDWVSHLVTTFQEFGRRGGVRYYQLDNEPDNWQALRKDIYPTFLSTRLLVRALLQHQRERRREPRPGLHQPDDGLPQKPSRRPDPTASVLFMSTENAQDLVALPNVECGSPAGPYTTSSPLTMAILKLAAAQEAAGHGRRFSTASTRTTPSPARASVTRARSGTARRRRSCRACRAGSTRPTPAPASA